ncbi:MAG TPA: DegT/DnrJ/EryC1/StrS family aminotransferase, partial [Actinopolymorphaceae bacterium]
VIEDVAHAHGATWKDKKLGSFGDFGCWSFQASKNMTSGEGGILCTNDQKLADTAWSLHHCGRSRTGAWYDHGVLGGNYRLTDFQSALLLHQLARLDRDVERREQSAKILDAGLGEIEGLRPLARDPRCTKHGYHLYMFWYDREGFGGLAREKFAEAMRAEGVPASVGYGVPLDRQGVFAQKRFDTKATGYDPDYGPTKYGELDLPRTWTFCENMIWIPQYVLLGDDAAMGDIVTAAAKVRAAAGDLAAAR